MVNGAMSTLAGLIPLLCLAGVNFAYGTRSAEDTQSTTNNFTVFWNVPSYLCEKYNIEFEPVLQKFGIIANKGALFRGEEVVILYDPGMFPAMLQDPSTKKLKERNGGIPQMGKLDAHLNEFEKALEQAVPKNFNGVGIIDFEAWRPNFRQNWNDQVIYRKMSKELERQKHPQWTEKHIEEQAKVNFEAAAKLFMGNTLKLAKSLRPNAKWGYYGFPYCYNSGKSSSIECPDLVKSENNHIQWLFDESTAFYPSIYSNSKLTPEEHKNYVVGRMNEARRMAKRASATNPPPTYPYVWYRFHDTFQYLSKERMFDALNIISAYKSGGRAMMWGSSNDLKSSKNCQELLNYVTDVLGPAIQRVNNGNLQDVSFGGVVVESR